MNEPIPRRFPPTTLGGPLPGDDKPSVDGPGPADLPRGWAVVSVRHVWRRALGILARRPEAILGTTALIALPYLVVRAVLWERLGLAAEVADDRAQLEIVALLRYAAEHERVLLVLLTTLFLLLPWVLQAALARVVVHEMRGTPISASESLRAGLGLRRWPAVLGVAILGPLAITCVAPLFSRTTDRSFFNSITDARLALPILWSFVFCAVPVVVLEGRGWWRAMCRVGELTTSNKSSSTWRAVWSPQAVAVVPVYLGWAGVWGALLLFGPGPDTPGRPLALLLVSGALTIAFAAFIAVTAAVAYAELCEADARYQVARVSRIFE